jgi:hypothetical protein
MAGAVFDRKLGLTRKEASNGRKKRGVGRNDRDSGYGIGRGFEREETTTSRR